MTLSRIRRALYRLASILGDVSAVRSLSPRKMAARYVRKRAWRAGAKVARRVEREVGL